MHRIDGDGHVGNLFTEGNPAIPQVATQVTDDWLNDMQENVCEAVTAAGIALVKGDYFQLREALLLMTQAVPPGGRLTLTTGVGVTTSDVSAAGTVYYTPHRGTRLALYDGTRWVGKTFAELSQATTDATKSPAACANNSNYDVFAWDDSGTLRATRGPAWSSDTARGTGAGTTELEFFEGRWVNKVAITNGPAARRGLYVGTVRTDGAAVVNDTLAKRHVWNMYNRVERVMQVQDANGSWNYTTATYRQANGSAANQLDFVLGLPDEGIIAEVKTAFSNTNTGVRIHGAIGLDSASSPTTSGVDGMADSALANGVLQAVGSIAVYPGLGRHFLAWLEYSAATGTTTFYGGAAAGLYGRLRA